MNVLFLKVLSVLKEVRFGFRDVLIIVLMLATVRNMKLTSRLIDLIGSAQTQDLKTSVSLLKVTETVTKVINMMAEVVKMLDHEDEKLINHLEAVRGTREVSVQGANVTGLDSRLASLEQALGQSPEKIILGLTLRKDLENLQERYKSDMVLIRDDVHRSEEFYRWFLGIIGAAILSQFLLKLFRKEKDG
jgi:hypothetical protein